VCECVVCLCEREKTRNDETIAFAVCLFIVVCD
jgi:hypothetical protein